MSKRIQPLIFLLFFVASSLVVATWAYAQESKDPARAIGQPIELVVRPGGERSLTPLAVPTIRVDSGISGASDADAKMRRAFELSGYFEVLGPDRFYFDVANEWFKNEIDYKNWSNVGAAGLVRTHISQDGSNVRLDFRLYDVVSNKEITLSGWKPKSVSPSRIDNELYAFVNAVIAYYSGSPGPFGGRIAFAGRGSGGYKQIYTVGVDGSGLHAVTKDRTIHLLPNWGPGRRVMYTSYADNNPDLWIDDASGPRKLVSYPGINSGGALSPDGKEIAVTLSRDGNTEIYIVDLQGKIVRRCTESNSEDLSPAWSPDGRQIAFVSDRAGGPQIFVMNRDCSNPHRVTMRGEYNVRPDWSPDGSRIAFTGRAGGRFDIFTVDPKSKEVRRITQAQGSNFDPTWSPDGRYLMFASTRGGGGARLVLSTADGQIQHIISDDISGVESPQWLRH